MKWEEVRFKDFIELQRGFDLPRGSFKDGEYPVIGSTSILGFHSETKCKAPGVVIGRSGTLGVVQYIESDYWPHNTSLWVKNYKKNHPLFVYYYLKLVDFKKFNSGGAVPTLNRNILDELIVPLPPIETQKKIAGILSAFDDLIENNLKRIKLLEESAQMLYKEWFVNFRFPGHETTKFVNGLPVGWERVKFESICRIYGGGTPSTKNNSYWLNGTIPWFTPTDLSKQKSFIAAEPERTITLEGLKNSSATLLPPNSIMLSSRATIGLITVFHEPYSTNQGFINIIPNDNYILWYLVLALSKMVDVFINNANGSTYKEITKTTFKQLELINPSEYLLTKFQLVCDNSMSQVRNLQTQNTKLKQARDMLLPKLLSGEIEV